MSRSQQKPNKMRSFEPNMNRTSMCDVQRLFKKISPQIGTLGGITINMFILLRSWYL